MTGAIKKYAEDRAGFAFVELMIVIALIGIMSAIAVPSYLRSLPEKKLRSATMNLYADMQKARLLAVKRNSTVVIRFDQPASNSYYIDKNNNNIFDGNEEVARSLSDYGGVFYGCTTKDDWQNPSVDIPDSGIRVNNKALSFTSTGTTSSGSIFLINNKEDNRGDVCYAVTATSFGAIKIRKFDNKNGWPKD